ncbi:acyl-CoA dehydrogenase family protein [Micromonospora sp. C95]|uniref:acyl-CoA dehydrogenase family protein n=1 Tax=Micromonospora sp. C95 TaxID=2824882 RepID=UPI001B376995|nr:acyl-CoA dehydrogenase family protein [Micromonospora sp. C95]MBQ1026050.1 acyl-CoA dehydrogenase family protein [Micromonospora sp. C95]
MSIAYGPVRRAKDWDALLGDPDDPDVLFSYPRCLRLDDTEAFPDDICAHLDELGLPAYYVPVAHGGLLGNFDDAATMVRLIARRDLTVAIAHFKTFLGAAPVWVAGTTTQADDLAATVLAGHPIALGLTERGIGSDLLATRTVAEPGDEPGSLTITGEKWLINNGRRATVVTTLVRTSPNAGPRALSLLLVDRRLAGSGGMTGTAKIPTHGIRGADISGVRYAGAGVGPAGVVGGIGRGVDTLLRALQVTRIATTPLSLGAADQALRLGYDFCADRELYGGRLVDLPVVRRSLGRAAAALFVAEAAVLLGCRAINALPEELSVVAAVVKAFVPSVVDDLIHDVGELLGARAFLLDVLHGGRFQKVERDHRIVGIFDGSTAVNQNYLAGQFSRLGRRYRQRRLNRDGVAVAADLARPLPPLELHRLDVLSPNGCSVVQALPDLLADPVIVRTVPAALLAVLGDAVTELHDELAGWRVTGGALPAIAFDLARRYELCFASASCLLLWRYNYEHVTTELWHEAEWLLCALTLLAEWLGAEPDGAADDLFIRLGGRRPEPGWGPPMSIFPATLADLR